MPLERVIYHPLQNAMTGVFSPSTGTGGSAYTPASTFLTVAGTWLYGWDNTDLKVNSDGTGGSVAEGGTIGQWNNRSGNGGNNVSQVTANIRPVWKEGSVRFFFATNTTTRQAYLRNLAIGAVPSANCSGGFVVNLPGISNTPIIDLGVSDLAAVGGMAAGMNYREIRQFNNSTYTPTGKFHTARKLVVTWRSNGTNIIWNVNGSDYTGTALAAVDMTRLNIASFNGGAPHPVNANEYVIFNTDVGATEIAKLQTYLRGKAGLDDPTRTVVVYGDSMGMGCGSEYGKPFHDYITNRQGSRWYAYCLDGGFYFTGLAHVTPAQVLAMKGSNEGVLIMWCGTNDMGLGTTAAQDETAMATFCSTVRAGGMKVVLCTLQSSAANGVKRDAFNALLVANSGSYCDALVRLDTAPELDDYTDTTYFTSDGVHLKDAGHAAVGALIQTAMAGLA